MQLKVTSYRIYFSSYPFRGWTLHRASLTSRLIHLYRKQMLYCTASAIATLTLLVLVTCISYIKREKPTVKYPRENFSWICLSDDPIILINEPTIMIIIIINLASRHTPYCGARFLLTRLVWLKLKPAFLNQIPFRFVAAS